jgi:DNA replication protein DnaC
MNDLSQLKPKLVRLKLSGVLETLEQRIAQAMEEKWEYSQFLLNLLTDEVIRRDNRQLTLRVGRSGLNPEKTIASFDFSFNKHIHKPTIRELATCSFIEQRRNLFFVGPSGVGKSHLSQALGNEACLKNIDVMYRGTHELLKWINAGRADGIAERRMQIVRSVPLLILDDFGLRPLSDVNQSDLYEIISARYEKRSTILTSNRDFAEWPMVFTNPLMGSAAMDRLVHRALKITIEGDSYRMNSFDQSLPLQDRADGGDRRERYAGKPVLQEHGEFRCAPSGMTITQADNFLLDAIGGLIGIPPGSATEFEEPRQTGALIAVDELVGSGTGDLEHLSKGADRVLPTLEMQDELFFFFHNRNTPPWHKLLLELILGPKKCKGCP